MLGFMQREVAAMHTNIKLAVAVVLGVVVATAVPSPRRIEPPVLRDDYAHELTPVVKPFTLRGVATWFDATKNNAWYTTAHKWGRAVRYYVAAGPALRKLVDQKWMMKPVAIWITSRRTGVTVKAYVVDWCGCQGRKADPDDTRVADLAPAIWDALGVPLGRGVMRVEIAFEKP